MVYKFDRSEGGGELTAKSKALMVGVLGGDPGRGQSTSLAFCPMSTERPTSPSRRPSGQ